jgi:hypothetical protein
MRAEEQGREKERRVKEGTKREQRKRREGKGEGQTKCCEVGGTCIRARGTNQRRRKQDRAKNNMTFFITKENEARGSDSR